MLRACNEKRRSIQGTLLRHTCGCACVCVCVAREKSPMVKENHSADRTLLAAGSRQCRAWIDVLHSTVPRRGVCHCMPSVCGVCGRRACAVICLTCRPGPGPATAPWSKRASRARLGQMGPAAGESGVRMSCRMLLLLQHQRNSVSWPSLAAAEHASQRLHDVMRMLFLRPAC